jgi:hypothetical protein
MTNRERLTKIFQGKLPDRPAVKLWGVRPNQKLLHPAYEPVYRLAMECTDLVITEGSPYLGALESLLFKDKTMTPFDLHWGCAREEIVENTVVPTNLDEWDEVVTRVHTPEGTLRSIFTKSTVGKRGYQKEYLLKKPDDIKKIFAVPYQPFPFFADSFYYMEQVIGDRGLTMFGLHHAMYDLHRLIGSENFALWSIECRDLLLEAIEVFSQRIREHVVRVFEEGLQPIFAWGGPELCIPPLMSPNDFEDFVFRFDKPLINLIHERGGYVWVHCHGEMGPVLERFVEMGVDVLNPIEPPPMGDVTLADAFVRVGDRMGLEGNIEIDKLMTESPERIRNLIHEAIETGSGRRFILCPSSYFAESPDPQGRLIENLLIFIKEGVSCAKKQR